MKSSIGIGNPIDRIEGHLKVTGMAKYASEFPVKNVVYAQGINSTIAKGEITAIDTSEAKKQAGVLEIITYQNAEKLKAFEEKLPAISPSSIAPPSSKVRRLIITENLSDSSWPKPLSRRNMRRGW